MKILYINSVCKRGSTGKIVYDLYAQGREAGLDTAICYGRGKKLQAEAVYKFGLDAETVAHAFLTRLTGYTGCFSPLSTKRLLRFMDAFQPDIVHLHEPHAYFMNLKPFFDYLAKHRIPLLYTMHCEFAYTGKCGYAYDCNGFKRGCGQCPHLKEYPKTQFFDHTASMLRQKMKLLKKQRLYIVTPSQWLANRVEESGLGGGNIRVIPNGINTEQVFYPRMAEHIRSKLGLKEEKLVLAVAPNFFTDLRKGGDYVLKLAERFSGEPVRFVMIGADSRPKQIPDNVVLLGRTENQQELAEYYSAADCFVICSQMENLPTTCLEAVCCEAPVVGFDAGGTAETAPYPLGRFSPYGDLDAMEKNLRQMLDSPPEKEDFAALRRKYASGQMFSEYAALYQEIMDGKTP